MSALSETSALTGKVKWFNNKAGFGFITVCDGELSAKDIFVHYSSIQVNNSQYKYLVQGEYVDFTLTKPENSAHEYHAVNVCGIKGGELMCETRRQNFVSRPARPDREDAREAVSRDIEQYAEGAQEQNPRREIRRPVRRAERRPVRAPTDDEGFKTVSRRRSAKPQKSETTQEVSL